MKSAFHLATALSLFALILQPRGASAQQINYSGYTRSGSFFGCGSAPKPSNGFWMITERVATRGTLSVAEYSRPFSNLYSWQLTGISGNQAVKMTWYWAFYDRNRGQIIDRRTTTLSMTMPKDYKQSGVTEPRQCW